MAALTALVGYIFGWRLGGMAGGLAAGLLVGCGPVFAMRTLYGRFDTDMFTVFMELLLVLFFTETLRAETKKGRILHACVFALTAYSFARCWSPRYSLLFAGLTFAGGLLFVFLLLIAAWRKEAHGVNLKGSPARGETRALLLCAALMVISMLLAAGPSIFGQLISALSFSTTVKSGEGVMPSLFVSVSELRKAKLFPDNIGEALFGYLSGKAPTAVNGVGGLFAFSMGLAGLLLLGMYSFEFFRRNKENLPRSRVCALYFCVLGAWFVAGLLLCRSGIRFIYHLSVSVGPLAAFAVGRVFCFARRDAKAHNAPADQKTDLETETVQTPEMQCRKKGRALRSFRLALAVLLLAVTVLPALTGSLLTSADSRPTVTDASEKTMQWIRDNAVEEDAVIASWWDMGYYYEYASGHPCLWDGGSQNSIRSILVSRALTADDLALSRDILRMLSGSGNAAVDFLAQHFDIKTAFDVLWTALPMEKNAALHYLCEHCSLTAEEAAEAEALIHPAEAKETYLVLSYTMTRQIGWYEYFANWDFTGTQKTPSATWYSRMPDGTSVFDSESGQGFLENVRSKETIWRLFFNAEQSDYFSPMVEWHDGLEHVRVWRVELG